MLRQRSAFRARFLSLSPPEPRRGGFPPHRHSRDEQLFFLSLTIVTSAAYTSNYTKPTYGQCAEVSSVSGSVFTTSAELRRVTRGGNG